MGLLSKVRPNRTPFGSRGKGSERPAEEPALEYFEVKRPSGKARCSDNSCPCPAPGRPLPHGGGYLVITDANVEFRRDARTVEAARKKAESMRGVVFAAGGVGVVTPILCCEQSPRLRDLNREVAAADAKYWWKTGKVPLRRTPPA